MRKIFLVRHGKPDMPQGERRYIGRTDVKLGTLGKLQAVLLSTVPGIKTARAVFCSPLSRSRETAQFLCPEPIVVDGLAEMSAGEWDGLLFDEVKERWPELYEARGLDPNIPIPGSENVFEGQKRFEHAVRACLDRSEGDIVIVAHATVNQSLLCLAKGVPADRCRGIKLACGSYSVLDFDGRFHVVQEGVLPHPALDDALCESLLDAAGADDRLKAHCFAVADQAAALCEELNRVGCGFNGSLVRSAALLHDIARACPDHPGTGAAWLNALGYEDTASVICQHHDPDSLQINEAALVYMADKLVQGSRSLTLEERFSSSLVKCRDEEAVKANRRRYDTAKEIKNGINSLCGKELIL